MGAETFEEHATGRDIDIAFASAVSQAQYEYGHCGYTGSLAEKNSFVLIDVVPDREAASSMACNLLDKADRRIDSKWGPAGAIEYKTESGERAWLFFGWASS